jgi:hypothetical protein
MGHGTVEVEVGTTPRQKMALYPGSSTITTILTTENCDSSMVSVTCFADKAGLFDVNVSATLWDNFTIYGEADNRIDAAWPEGAIPYNSSATFGMDTVLLSPTITISNTILALVHGSNQTYPGGSILLTEVGILSLVSPEIADVLMVTSSGSRPETIQSMSITGWLYESGGDDRIPSYSYGMHVGSARLGIPGSLVLGGYDQNRVLGEVSSQTAKAESALHIVLVDIGIGTASGPSAWNYTRRDGLLALEPEFSEDPSGINVTIDAGNPYLYLPQVSCHAIASQLPVTYQDKYGLYFWNTKDSRYHGVMNSTAYLSFTFVKNMLDDANITIKVPFVLLDLTLDQPLIDTATKYFPCMPSLRYHGLGRAFLQAAFIGVNWGNGSQEGNWFLAQAPGPNTTSGTAIVNIEPEDFEIAGSTLDWEDSWGTTWRQAQPRNKTASSVSTASPSPFNSSTATGLSPGAKAGVGLGSGIAGLTVSGLLLFFYHGYILSMFHRFVRKVYKMIPQKTMRRASSMVNTAEASRRRISNERNQQETFLNKPLNKQGEITAEASSIGDRGES